MQAARHIALATLCWPTLAQGDVARFEPGMFVMRSADYDWETDRFTEGAPEGEETACFRIDAVRADEVDMTLVSGLYHPWWTDAPLPVGFEDTWSNSDAFTENRPGAAPLSLTRALFSDVTDCGGPQ